MDLMAGSSSPPRQWADFDVTSLAEALHGWGFPRSHAKPILRQFYATGGALEGLEGRVGPRLMGLLRELIAPDGTRVARRHVAACGTVKLLVHLPAGGAVEAVLMPSHRPGRAAACVSSQVGCAMGCDFCASTKGGLERNLSMPEIVAQFLHLSAEAKALGRRIGSLVFMGMGEPMQNLDAVLPAIRRIADPDLGGVGWRQVTVSTVGIVPGIDRLADADLNVHLALSLHAADDALRTAIVPMNRKYGVAEIMSAAKRFHDRTGRVVTVEWCLIEGVNDGLEQADKLANLLRQHDLRAHVNVIPFNPIGVGPRGGGAPFRRPDAARVAAFVDRLRGAGVVCHERQVRGDDVSAACGQLRRAAAGTVEPASTAGPAPAAVEDRP